MCIIQAKISRNSYEINGAGMHVQLERQCGRLFVLAHQAEKRSNRPYGGISISKGGSKFHQSELAALLFANSISCCILRESFPTFFR